ncbi:hypothetical protein [Paenibacillus sp. sgz500958]|uniref:hypothetical protein n=1 Tax=Paenibacillus sp. sgz500958 TaxID=3242475 RepID=UPI0036D321B3
MLIVLMYLFTFIGVSLLLLAAVLKLKRMFPRSDPDKLIVAVTAVQKKFSKHFMTPNHTHIIALDDTARTLSIGSFTSSSAGQTAAVLLSYEDIAGCEILENALTLTKVSRTSRINRISVSSMTDRAVISGNNALYEAADNAETIHELVLKIYISRADLPSFQISFLPGTVPISKTDIRYCRAFEELLQLHSSIRAIVSP